MPEQTPEHDPGHLDIDAVSAYVDSDLEAADVAAIRFHLRQCPACDREVLEIRTTVVLLSGLPQYEPRRSFCLGQEHARAGRRRSAAQEASPWTPPALPLGQPGSSTTVLPPAGSSGPGWLPGLHVAALVVGALLLLVTVGDLTGFAPGDDTPMQLAAPTAAAELPPPPMAALPAAEMAPRDAVSIANDIADDAGPGAPMAAFQPDLAADGTESDNSASQEMLAEQEPPAAARVVGTSAGIAAVTRAIPTPGAGVAPAESGGQSDAAIRESAGGREEPSRLRIVQLALALALAWIVVSIVGLRWVRRGRQA